MWLISVFFFFLMIWTSLSKGKQIGTGWFMRVCFFFIIIYFCAILAVGGCGPLSASVLLPSCVDADINRPASSSSSMRNDCFRKLCWNIYEMLQQSLRNSADLRVFVNFLKLSQSLRKHSSDTINEHEWKMNVNMQVTSVTCGRSALCARIPRMCFHLSHVFGVSLCDSLLCGFQRWMVDWNDTRVTDENILECIKWGQIILFIHL